MQQHQKYSTEIKEAQNLTNEELLLFVAKIIIKQLSHKFSFGYHTPEDISQEIWIFILKGLKSDKFDPSYPLEKYLYTVVKNQLINLKRNKFTRHSPPCVTCPFYIKSEDGCELYGDAKDECEKYKKWKQRNLSKAILSNAASNYESYSLASDDDTFDNVLIDEISEDIYNKLSNKHKGWYKKLLQGKTIDKHKIVELESIVMEILIES